MSTLASYRHRLNPSQAPVPADPEPVKTAKPERTLMAIGLTDQQEPVIHPGACAHQHHWRRLPADQQSMAASNRFIWGCTGCNALKTLDSSMEP